MSEDSVNKDSKTQWEKVIPLSAKQYRAVLGKYLKPQWRKAALMAALLLASIGLQLLEPQILRFFIDTAQEGGALRSLMNAAVFYLMAAVAIQILGAFANYLGADVGWSATNLVRQDLAEHTMNLDMKFHNSRTAGEMIERIDGDVTALSDFFSQFSVRVFGGLLLLLGILVVLWVENIWVGLAMTTFVVLEFAVLYYTRERAVPATRLEREANAKIFGFIEERLAGLEDIRANGGGAHAMYRFNDTMRDFYNNSRKAWMLRSTIWMTGYGMFILGMTVTIAAAIFLVTRGSITVGTGYLVLQYMFMLQGPIEQITQQMQTLQKAAASIGRINELFSMKSELPQGKNLALPTGATAIRFDRVNFSYDDKPTLKDVSFILKPGTVLGLLGRTGSGKTTLTRLLFRFYDVTSGSVRLNGVDVREADLKDLHSHIGMVTQEVQLFQASVRDNLTFFDTGISDERIKNVLTELGLMDWLESLPEGLDTNISAAGGNLSAGEAQLLAFARVFLKDPGLIILDEPSSRLDPATEKRLELALNKLLRGRTAIIIAHRLDTVQRADEIMILDNGRILEHDRREKLESNTHSRFYQLLRAGRSLDEDIEELA
ncbi:MAG: ABC transporter ATP-binding protein [Trueperaceae bacterium]